MMTCAVAACTMRHHSVVRRQGRGGVRAAWLMACWRVCCPQYGVTELVDAARNGRKDVVTLLLESKADVDAKDKVGGGVEGWWCSPRRWYVGRWMCLYPPAMARE